VRFIDARPVLRVAAAKSVLHGPQDWNHFNDDGYQVLGAFVARAINDTVGNECMNWSAPQR
jgi:hypothetical protein